MTVSDDVDTPLWVMGSGHPRPRQASARCALCPDPPASVFGLCPRCLASAAAEAARLLPPQPSSGNGRLSSTPLSFSSLCGRCGQPGHHRRDCDA